MAVDAIIRHIQNSTREPGIKVRGVLDEGLAGFAEPVYLFSVGLPVYFAVHGVRGLVEMLVVEILHLFRN
jgi:hypothetical protein